MKNEIPNPMFRESGFYKNPDDFFGLSYYNISEIIRKTKGKFFRVTFVKADGSIRNMVCRLGVKIGVNGNGKPYDDFQVRVFDIQKHAWRSFKLDRLIEIKCGQTFLSKKMN